jgi:quercetin dioxygenase-like cupin family protein
MAIKDKIISNPVTGQTIRFIQTAKDTNGALLEMESSFAPHSSEPVPHFHPIQNEVFDVLEGSISVRINGKVKVIKKGEQLQVPANTIHSMWNHTGDRAHVNWKVQPALNTESFFETAMGLATEKKINKKGMPSILQTALMVRKFSNEFRLAKPGKIIQKILFSSLTPIAKLAGFEAVYEKYID